MNAILIAYKGTHQEDGCPSFEIKIQVATAKKT